ncbi:MAG: peptidoglycan-binding domain-containing protein [bacterium]|nr:peptidoglycan-binding domain-containing protein [bacterium]
MLRKIVLSGVGLLLLATPLLASAQSVNEQIASLLALVKSLQAQIVALQAQSGGQSFCHNFNSDLTVGSSGDDVSALNQALSSSGVNTTGNTSYFSENNAGDVVSFQAKYGIRQTGYVGPLTRAKLNALYKCGTQQTQSNQSTALSCGNGNDYYDGGEGVDTLTYAGKRSDFTITQNANGSYTFKDTVPCRAGTDTVVNTEQFYFADGLYTLQNLNPDFISQSTSDASTSAAPSTVSGTSPTISSFVASPTSIALGEQSKLGWWTSGANICRLIVNGDGLGTVPVNGNQIVSPTVNTEYTLRCGTQTTSSDGGSVTTNEVSRSVKVTVTTSTSVSTGALKIGSVHTGVNGLVSSKDPFVFEWSGVGIASDIPIKVYIVTGLNTINIGQIYSNGGVQTTTLDSINTILAPYPPSVTLLQSGDAYLLLKTKTLDAAKYSDTKKGPFPFVVE